MSMKQYDAKDVKIMFGAIPISVAGGLVKDSFITIEKDENDYELYVGCDGEGTRSRNNKGSHTIKIKVQASSMANDLLSAQRVLDLAATNGVGVVPFGITTIPEGRSLGIAQEAWIEKPPAMEFGAEVGECEWTIKTLGGTFFYGGN